MVDVIKGWAASVAVAAAVSAIIGFLTPQGGIQRSVKFLTGVFTVLMFVLPLKNVDSSLSEYTYSIEESILKYELEETVEKQVADSLAEQIKGEISAFLNKNHVIGYEIETEINIDNQKNISIESIVINIPDIYSEKTGEIYAFVKEKFNFEPQFYYFGEG